MQPLLIFLFSLLLFPLEKQAQNYLAVLETWLNI